MWKLSTFVGCVWILLGMLFWVAIVVAAWHFVAKYW
jgi:hypothetical protein